MELDNILVEDKNGVVKEAEVITVIIDSQNARKYAVYTFNPEDPMVDIYASEIREAEDGRLSFVSVKTENEWKYIQTKLTELASE